MEKAEKRSRVPELIKLAAGPITFLAVYLVPLEGLSYEGQVVLATLGWAAAWWLLQPIPWAITSLLPLVIFPVLGVMSIGRTTSLYGQNLFFWLLGLIMFGYALKKHGLANRIALHFLGLKGVGNSTAKLIFMFMLSTGILSMFASDAAVAAMMIPIAISLYAYVSQVTGATESKGRSALASFLVLGVVYASQAGGVGSIAGLPANAVVVSLVDNLTDRSIGWFNWMMVGVPLFLIEIVCFYGLLRYFFPPEVSTIPGGQEFIRGEIQKLGKMSRGEVNVLIVFMIMLFLFTMPAVVTLVVGGGHPVAQYLRGAVPIWVVPPLVLILLFLLPVNFEKGEGTLVWRDVAEHASWNIIFLVTGAVGMTEALAEFGFMEFVQGVLTDFSLGSVTLPVVAAVVTAISTNIVSGTAAATLFASIFIPVADQLGVNPATIGMLIANASVGILFPWSGALAATAFASGHVDLKEMIKVGLVATVLIVFITLAINLLFAPIF